MSGILETQFGIEPSRESRELYKTIQ
jgi:hypothetical protein